MDAKEVLDDIRRGVLEQRHRDAMLDVVLAWAELDGWLGMLLAKASGLTMYKGAENFGRMPSKKKIEKILEQLQSKKFPAVVIDTMKKYQENYLEHSDTRSKITHAKCIGISRADAGYIYFAKFEKFCNGIAFDKVPVDAMKRSTNFARELSAFAETQVDDHSA